MNWLNVFSAGMFQFSTVLSGTFWLVNLHHKFVRVECILSLSRIPLSDLQFLKNSISYRGAILWNAVSGHFTDQFTVFYRKVKKDSYFKELDFSAQSVQSLPRHYQDFKYF